VAVGKKKMHIVVDEDIYAQLWEIAKRRYINPTGKLHIVIDEAFREYIKNHQHEIKGS
jgi:ABC-type branched-subunit amino acid transport system substrate-binding protein